MKRATVDADLTLSIGGEAALVAALAPDDLVDLGEILKAMRSYDPSLRNIRMTGSIREGSAIVDCIAPEPPGLDLVRPARDAARGFFERGGYDEALGWTWTKGPREALNRLTKRGCTLSATIPQHGAKPFQIQLDRKHYEAFSRRIAEEPTWGWVKGKLLEVDYKDRTFEVHTVKGVLVCPFPEALAESEMDGKVRRTVSVHALCRTKPSQGAWKAEICKSVLLVPQEAGLAVETYPAGIHPPRQPMASGFQLSEFAPSLDAQAGEDLDRFLQALEG